MNISDIRTRLESVEASSKAELDDGSVLTLVEVQSDAQKPDPLIQALVEKLPKPNTVWPIAERARWLKAAAVNFNLVYKSDEGDVGDLKIDHRLKPTGSESMA